MARQKRTFLGMSYREVQKWNSENRTKLDRQQQQKLKEEGFRNVGWESVIGLYLALDALINSEPEPELESSLEELFLEAARIGDKYQTEEDRATFQREFDREIAEINALIEEQFPQPQTIEFIDYSR
ncbi:MAG: hypothetical protein P5702_00225 [Limnospira sp. PMC 1291.21]|uniref:Uncharacterized protein n=1 Tax=Limnospira fusiformis PMC 851.14 TaxID=2219512 RepID=A0ABU9EIB1_LIMFS|nr:MULTISPECIES: hypothetical protein [Limnospira]EKD07446.1 hypothetical protein SPLC1_S411130 [Arthrospira platensis C1]QJB25775.1 hypothetical protein HFV01_08185 [Limnospira fusiformis SAG 85.79]MDT9176053.1 hypothetical protein [Limnospira sp. PMC 1238.20]MDT9191372.1 hypothetical protein [Limnospira sp. PMC 1245.20]MDT9196766.1 hypothetical protein [Limnospira sp. PMC 1042.18]